MHCKLLRRQVELGENNVREYTFNQAIACRGGNPVVVNICMDSLQLGVRALGGVLIRRGTM